MNIQYVYMHIYIYIVCTINLLHTLAKYIIMYIILRKFSLSKHFRFALYFCKYYICAHVGKNETESYNGPQ